jgi:hypothetical protein
VNGRVPPPLFGASPRCCLGPHPVVTVGHACALRPGVVDGGRCRGLSMDASRRSQISIQLAGQGLPARLPSGIRGQPGPGEARVRHGTGGARAVEAVTSPTAAQCMVLPCQARRGVGRDGVHSGAPSPDGPSQTLAPDTGERGSSVVGVTLLCSPVQVKHGVRRHRRDDAP